MIKKVEGNIVDTIVEIFTVRYYEERSDDLNIVRRKGTDRNRCPNALYNKFCFKKTTSSGTRSN